MLFSIIVFNLENLKENHTLNHSKGFNTKISQFCMLPNNPVSFLELRLVDSPSLQLDLTAHTLQFYLHPQLINSAHSHTIPAQ